MPHAHAGRSCDRLVLAHSRMCRSALLYATAFWGRRCRFRLAKYSRPSCASVMPRPRTNPDPIVRHDIIVRLHLDRDRRQRFVPHSRHMKVVLCPGDSILLAPVGLGDFPASWSKAAAYLPCLARAYGMILHRITDSTITRNSLRKRKTKWMDTSALRQSRGVIEHFREYLLVSASTRLSH